MQPCLSEELHFYILNTMHPPSQNEAGYTVLVTASRPVAGLVGRRGPFGTNSQDMNADRQPSGVKLQQYLPEDTNDGHVSPRNQGGVVPHV